MIRIIPAIDIIDGKCVRLSQGDYGKKTIYNENPLEEALKFESAGIKYLHLVDLDGAREKKIVNFSILEKIASKTKLKIDFGGGLRSDKDIEIAFNAGANQITAGSVAIQIPEIVENWIEKYGSEKIILGSDCRDKKISISGWQEKTEISVFDFIEDYKAKGIKYTISTDVSKDGLLEGPATDYYKELKLKFPDLNIIASGGISKMQDIIDLNNINLYGVIVGKAIYENKISLQEISQFLG